MRTILDLDLKKILSKVESRYGVAFPRGVLAVEGVPRHEGHRGYGEEGTPLRCPSRQSARDSIRRNQPFTKEAFRDPAHRRWRWSVMGAICKVRARDPSEADFDEAKEGVISSCTKAMEKFRRYQETLIRMIIDALANFPDPTSTPNRRRRTRSSLMFEEEERASRQVEKEEWQELHPSETTIRA